MAKTTTTTTEDVSTMNTVSIVTMSEDEIIALYNKSLQQMSERGRQTQQGEEYLKSLDRVFSVLNKDELPIGLVGFMLNNLKQDNENILANTEGRTPVKQDVNKTTQSINAFMKTKHAAGYYTVNNDVSPKTISKKINYN